MVAHHLVNHLRQPADLHGLPGQKPNGVGWDPRILLGKAGQHRSLHPERVGGFGNLSGGIGKIES